MFDIVLDIVLCEVEATSSTGRATSTVVLSPGVRGDHKFALFIHFILAMGLCESFMPQALASLSTTLGGGKEIVIALQSQNFLNPFGKFMRMFLSSCC